MFGAAILWRLLSMSNSCLFNWSWAFLMSSILSNWTYQQPWHNNGEYKLVLCPYQLWRQVLPTNQYRKPYIYIYIYLYQHAYNITYITLRRYTHKLHLNSPTNGVIAIALLNAYMSQTGDRKHFTISEVAVDYYEAMVTQRIMWPSHCPS